jgi:hypothetical protein
MSHKLILVLSLALIALVWPTAIVKNSAARTGPSVGVDCIYLPLSQLRCQAEVYGGTAPYTYEWGPPPLSGSGHALRVGCAGTGTKIISVTVTDANGEIGYFSAPFQCAGSGGLPYQ